MNIQEIIESMESKYIDELSKMDPNTVRKAINVIRKCRERVQKGENITLNLENCQVFYDVNQTREALKIINSETREEGEKRFMDSLKIIESHMLTAHME